jgi:hypothetical protein
VRISWTGAVASVASACLLVVGVDYATFATTGNSLILGHINRAGQTTRLANTAGGTALRLSSSDDISPALAVNNDVKVRHLNAAELDGMTASSLASHAVTFTGGRRGDRIHGIRVWNLPVPVGAYQVGFKAAVIPRRGSPQLPVQVVCGIADFNTIGPRTHIYTADSATYMGGFPAIMSGAEAVRIRPGTQPVLLCTTQSGATGTVFRLFAPVTASFTALNSRTVQTAQQIVTRGSQRMAGLRLLRH